MLPRPPELPRLDHLHQLLQSVSQACSKQEAKPLVVQLRIESRKLRQMATPLVASLLARVSRDAEAASGTVLEKSRRLAEMQESWELLIRMLGGL
jgi:hypothetical protein